jgi:hypothetical protein
MTTGTLSPSLLSEVSKCVAKARTYLLGRQSDEGGFCFYRAEGVDEPSLRDTYHAIIALKLLGTPVPDLGRLLEFVQGARLFGLTYTYFYAFTLDLLGLSSNIVARYFNRVSSADRQRQQPGLVRGHAQEGPAEATLRRRMGLSPACRCPVGVTQ